MKKKKNENVSESARRIRELEEKLVLAQHWYSEIAASIPGVVYQFRAEKDGTYSFPYISERVYDVFGVANKEIMADANAAFDRIIPEDLPGVLLSIRQSAQSMSRWSHEFRIINAWGDLRWLQGMSNPGVLPDGALLWNGVLLDITEKRLAEEAGRRSELQYRSFFENTGTAVIIIEPDTVISLANNEFLRITGYDREEVEGRMRWTEFVDPGDLEMMKSYHYQRRVDPQAAPRQYEFRLKIKSGEIRHSYITVGMVPESSRSVASIIDITDRIRIENELRESERKFKDLANMLPLPVFELDDKLMFTFSNSSALKQFGYTREDFENGISAVNIVHPDYREKIFRNIAARIKGGEPHDHDYRVLRKDGSVFPASVYVSVIRRDDQVVGFRGICIDNTSQKRQEDVLREIEERYRTFVDTSPDSIVLTELSGTIILANRMTALQHGYQGVKEMVGTNAMDLYAPSSRKRIVKGVRDLLKGGELKGMEVDFQRWDGKIFPVELSISVMRDVDGNPYALIGIARDIAERKKMEEEMQKRQKLDSLGVLAGGIAHDFNNILTAILGNISLARSSMNPADPAQERLTVAEHACYQAKNLTMQLLTFSKGGAPVKRVLYIGELLKDTVQFSLSGTALLPSFTIQEDLWPAEVDEGQIRQVIQNLVVNAEEAMPDSGQIEIAARNVAVGRDDGLAITPGRYVMFSIRDHGTGIPAKYLKKIFDPYFTTKQKGSGLGLAVSYSIITRHNGLITAESKEGEGTTFSIYLPASAEAVSGKEAKPERVEKNAAAGSILVMDDEDLILNVATHMLGYLGYRYVTARSGEEAVDLYRQHLLRGERFDAVIMDLTIPGGMGGREAVRKIIELDPTVKAIVSSGYYNDPVIASFREHGFAGVIQKPYVIEDLSSVLKEVLAPDK